MTDKPLRGVKVIDFGQYIAAPAVAMMLADLGALVVHIDPPAGPLWDSPANAILQRNKHIVNLDLKTADGVADALRLIDEADIVVEGFRPGVMKRLGIDFTALRAAQPDLITLSVPGFASDDELRRDWRAFESVIAATSGVFSDMGLNRILMGVNPSFSPLPLGSAYATVIAAAAVMLALFSRAKTGVGEQIEVPLASALMEGLAYNSLHIENAPDRYKTLRQKEIERRRIEGLPMNVSYEELQEFLDPFFRNYKCKDGRMFYVVCPSHRGHVRRCLETLGLYDELAAEGFKDQIDVYTSSQEWAHEVSLGLYPLPRDWADHIAERMKAVFLTRTTKEWERIFGRGRFPGSPQRWLQEWINDDHAETAGLMLEVSDPVYGLMTQPAPLVWMQECGEAMLAPSPRRWVSSDEALARLQALPTQLPRRRAQSLNKGFLDGIRIVDLCNVIAGPHSTAFLARFGAEVIKIDPASPEYDPTNTVIYGLTHLRSKRSCLLDFRPPAGRAALNALIKNADVVVWNATDEQVKRLGFDAKTLEAINPQAIFCQLDCFGGIRTGPRSNYPGYDDLVQATTGVMLRFGGGMDTPEEHAHVGTIDVMCGFGAAMGIATALFARTQTGQTYRPRTSLAALSGLLQLPYCYDYARRGLFDEPSGPETPGLNALTRFYQASNGHVLLSAYETDLPRLAAIEPFAGIEECEPDDRAAFLAAIFATARAEDWVDWLQGAGIGAAVCETLETIRAYNSHAPIKSASYSPTGTFSFTRYEDHPSGHVITQADPHAVRLQERPIATPRPGEKYGQSTRAILQLANQDEDRIEALLSAGIASESWGEMYLPD